MAVASIMRVGAMLAIALMAIAIGHVTAGDKPPVPVRGIYGGVPTEIFDRGQSLSAYGINAVWVGSGGLTRESVALLKKQGAKVFAEFNTMHDSAYLKDHPDAAPVGTDGKPCPPPDGWQGVCPTHPGYREGRMKAFRQALRDFEIDGIWLDYHHSHASWEQAEPEMPDTCFCARCLARFEKESGVDLPESPTPELARVLLGPHKGKWVAWRCGVFTDWVREFRAIRDEVRPSALLGTFHCPWSEDERGGALRSKLAIDLKAQAKYLDVFSPMPYHARFGHAADPAWIGQQIAWLGRHLGIEGKPNEKIKIWPIVQLTEWGEPVPITQVAEVINQATRPPATGVMAFVWGTLAKDWAKVERLGKEYRALHPGDDPPPRKTEVAIRGDSFLINGTPTYAGRTWQGRSVEGLLLNARLVQGIFDDLNSETRSMWAYPDTGRWDPERNTREFLAAMPEWRRHGLLGFTINLQGGSPQGYTKGRQPWHNSAITAKGELRPEYLDRLRRILDKADELGMVAILGVFYFGQDERLQDEAAVVRALDAAVDWVLDRGYRNVLIEVNNECDVQYDHAVLRPDRVHELIGRVKERRRGDRRLLAGTSYGGGAIPRENVVRVSDFLLIHGNGVSRPARIAEMVRETRQVPGYRPMPILFNEDDHFDFDQPENNLKAALSERASWGYFDPGVSDYQDGYQSPPVEWRINTPRKRAFFAKVREIAED